jgi:hypothetical protein
MVVSCQSRGLDCSTLEFSNKFGRLMVSYGALLF